MLVLKTAGLIAIGWLSSRVPIQAADVVIRVNGALERRGEVGCALFASKEGFPIEGSRARQLWVPAAQSTTCRFTGIAPGRYAVSVSQDLNGNRKTDTNLLGIPTEPWGVSNDVRPRMRAPRFEEAAFEVAGEKAEVEVRISK